jgi:pyridoxine 5-phosphate synthase
MPVLLSVNLNKIALIRNSRGENTPDIKKFAELSIASGAGGLTVHPRPDQRHVRADDVPIIGEVCRTHKKEFNIEGNPFASQQGSYPGLLALVKANLPTQCTLVPDDDAQLTSDHGFDLNQDFQRLEPIVKEIRSWGVRVSLFMDPDCAQIKLASEVGADRIELYTGPFAKAFKTSIEAGHKAFEQHIEAANYAQSLGLGVNAGHDLDQENMEMYRALPYLQEVSIGHALTSEALISGFANTVEAYAALCNK